MSREKTEAIIYKLIRYSDSSAIGFAFSKEFGRLKLFVPKAFSKKGGVVCFMPGMLDFSKKDSDLSKFYGFDNNTEYYHYLNNHEIVMRMHLVFEIFDGMYQPEMPDAKLFELMTKYDDTNFRKLTSYIIYFMLKKSGVMYDLAHCENCGSEENLYTISERGLHCDTCAEHLNMSSFCDKESAYIIKSMASAQLYRNVTMTRKQELQVIKAMASYAETVLEKPLKSIKTLLDII